MWFFIYTSINRNMGIRTAAASAVCRAHPPAQSTTLLNNVFCWWWYGGRSAAVLYQYLLPGTSDMRTGTTVSLVAFWRTISCVLFRYWCVFYGLMDHKIQYRPKVASTTNFECCSLLRIIVLWILMFLAPGSFCSPGVSRGSSGRLDHRHA